jgi:hypothetical protein
MCDPAGNFTAYYNLDHFNGPGAAQPLVKIAQRKKYTVPNHYQYD